MFNKINNELLSSALGRARITKQVKASQVLGYLESLLVEHWGEAIKKRAKPIYVKDKKAVIAVMSSVVANEIHLQRHQLIKKTNQRFGQNTILEIQLDI
ncbi:DUF721 domain-containing protein [Patescibacteria group bacterium]|nr:DUF721 domain-containing protein [Patescibacteria group bacterium]MBU1890956.1 DUF721 domain-containing protein [Patescibacteria group bacterium]